MTLYSKMELYYTALLNAVQTNYNEKATYHGIIP